MNKNITIVTCFYKLKNSKHTFKEYNLWIHNFLLNLKSNIIIFTSEEDYNFIKAICSRNSNLNYKIIIKELYNFCIYKKYQDIWKYQEKIDPQKKNVNRKRELYILWNSKLDLVKESINLNPFNSDKFIWNDIGNVRDISQINYIKNYPKYENISNNKIDIVILKNRKKANFLIKSLKIKKGKYMFYQNSTFFSGSIFGSNKDILLKLHDLYYYYFNLYIKNKLFIGCDQQILRSIYKNNKDMFNLVESLDWFYLQKYYTV